MMSFRVSLSTAKNRITQTKVIRILGKLFLLWLVPFLILESFFLSEFLKNYNYIEVFPKELIFPTVMHATTALIVAIVIFAIKRPKGISAKLVGALLMGLFMVNYQDRLAPFVGIFRSIMPILPAPGKDMPIISLLFIALLFAIVAFVGILFEKLQAKKPFLDSKNTLGGILIITSIIFLGQAIPSIKILAQMVPQSRTQPNLLPRLSKAQANSEKPDIYYIVLDRYTNDKVLKEQFNFDNSKFTNFLKANGFHVNEEAYSNYPYTTMSISSTLNANYTKDYVQPHKDDTAQSRTLYHNLIRQSSVIKALKSEGYQYLHIGSWYGATNKAPLADIDYMHASSAIINKKTGRDIKRLRGLESSQFIKSPYTDFLSAPGSQLSFISKPYEDQVRGQINTLHDIAESKTQGGRFIFAHILVPHDPFIFNADGSINISSGTDSTGLPIKQKYTNQVEFINQQMQDLISQVQKNSNKKAVILLNADEGPYPQYLNDSFLKPTPSTEFLALDTINNEDQTKWSKDWLQMKFGNQQAVYAPNIKEEELANNLSSVNLFRLVLNNYFSYSLDYLPSCHFVLASGTGSEFRYKAVTDSNIFGPVSSECTKYQTVN